MKHQHLVRFVASVAFVVFAQGALAQEAVIRKNIAEGRKIACRVPTDYLIVAGVSNWGAYALGAGVALVRNAKIDPVLFDADKELALLQKLGEAGPLVDGVSGEPVATVDGLTWEQYVAPLVRIGQIVGV